MKMVAARYRKKGANPFDISRRQTESIKRITIEVDDNTPLESLVEPAKQATPEGYEFIEVIEI